MVLTVVELLRLCNYLLCIVAPAAAAAAAAAVE